MLMHQLLLDGAARTPDKMAFRWVDRKRTLTYAEMVVAMEDMAGALHALGVRRGDRVGVLAHNGLDYLVTMFGAWRIGAIAALVNVKLANDLEYYWNDHSPRVVVYTHDLHDIVAQCRKKVASVQHLVCMDGPQEGAFSLPELLAAKSPAPADPWNEDAIAHLSYTSGTTGKSKGVCLRHEPTVTAARCIAERLQIRARDVSFGPTALSSSYQLVANLLPPLSSGASIHIMGKWTQDVAWDAIEEAGATLLVGNPVVLAEVLDESLARGRPPGHLRLALTGGSPLPPTLKAKWRDQLNLPIVESYGQSELGGFVALGYPELIAPGDDLIRIGPALPDKEVRVVDGNDAPLPVGAVGEVVLRGGFMDGYWDKPEQTAEATRNGWLRTGDLGFLDSSGHLTLRGRRAELIAVAGVDWYPRDVEEALCRQPGIRQAALIGYPDKALGRRPIAFVCLGPNTVVDRQALRNAIAAEVAYDLSYLDIVVADALPMTPTGKISKSELMAIASTTKAVARPDLRSSASTSGGGQGSPAPSETSKEQFHDRRKN